MNADLGRKVLDHVTAHREQFDMSDFGHIDPECGTVCCLGGWAMVLSGYHVSPQAFFRPDGSVVGSEGDEARELLGLSDEEYAREYEGSRVPSLFLDYDEDRAIERFRALVEAAEAVAAS